MKNSPTTPFPLLSLFNPCGEVLPLAELKKDLEFNEEISEIVDILKNIAISYFHHLKQRERFEEFTSNLENFLQGVDFEGVEHPFLEAKSVQKSVRSETSGRELVVIITSDEPFVGGLNIRVINAALSEAKLRTIGLVVIGEQGRNYLEETDKPFTYFRGIDEELEYQQIKEVKDYLLSEYLKEDLKRVIVVYPHFISFSHQEVEVFQLLPYKSVGSEQYAVDKKLPTANCQLSAGSILIEPSLNRVADYLIRLWVGEKLYGVFYESKLSELAARAMHLEGSFLELSRIRKDLKLQYIRSLHEAMDKANRDIFASRTLWGE